ncbi:cysteine synthase A [Treponema primitia]|uniref:cysteine synthase A n=1 Tax=Treponema primitia TaxID=88058 RepID=UPI00025558CA|nr:cysteine synthase A [Treponema primitia]
MSISIAQDATQLIGGTPLVKLNRLAPKDGADVYVKLESFNIGGSVKDRIALNMINAAEAEGKIKPGDTLIEVTSGNTGIGLALVAAVKGYKLIIVMGDNVSVERRQLAQAYGAEVVIVSAVGGIKTSFDKAAELIAQHGYFEVKQFENPHNPETHERTTGPEIVEALGKAPDAFVAGIGTGGTITGVGRYLKKLRSDVRIVAVEPDASPVLSGGTGGPHAIQGIGAGIIPKVLDTGIYDEIIRITNDEARDTARALAAKEGLLLGYSAAAAILSATRVAERLGKGKSVVVIAPDTGERYLSTPLYKFE